MMMSNSASAPPYQGRVRGLRQGGIRKMKTSKSTKLKAPPIGAGDRFKNLVGQLSHKSGTASATRQAAFSNVGKKRK